MTTAIATATRPGPTLAVRAVDRIVDRGADRPAADARHHTQDVLTRWGIRQPDAELVVTEYVTNALRYTAGPVVLSLATDPGTGSLIIGVRDADPRRPAPPPPEDTDMSGRGLHIIEAVSTACGCDVVPGRPGRPGHKQMWAELPTTPAETPGEQAA